MALLVACDPGENSGTNGGHENEKDSISEGGNSHPDIRLETMVIGPFGEKFRERFGLENTDVINITSKDEWGNETVPNWIVLREDEGYEVLPNYTVEDRSASLVGMCRRGDVMDTAVIVNIIQKFADSDGYSLPTVYAVGSCDNSPTYWINGTAYPVMNDGNAVLEGLVLHDGQMYIVGAQGRVATCWVDGVAQALPSGNYSEAWASCIAIDENTIYIGGCYYDKNGSIHPAVWVNGKFHECADESVQGLISDIALENGDLYLLSFDRYYKNNDKAVLLDSNHTLDKMKYLVANAIHVVGTDVYVGGHCENLSTRRNQGFYWKNGQLTLLDEDSEVMDILSDGTNFFFSGRGENDGASFWKNGEKECFYSPGSGRSLSKDENYFYVGGCKGESPALWIYDPRYAGTTYEYVLGNSGCVNQVVIERLSR